MDRETYRRGIQALKLKIRELANKQRACKRVLRMPRKTADDRAKLQTEVDRLMPPTKYGHEDVSWLQSITAARRFKISTYLNVYAEVRGKAPCHHSEEAMAYLPGNICEARKDFEDACGTTADLSLLPWRAGSLTSVK